MCIHIFPINFHLFYDVLKPGSILIWIFIAVGLKHWQTEVCILNSNTVWTKWCEHVGIIQLRKEVPGESWNVFLCLNILLCLCGTKSNILSRSICLTVCLLFALQRWCQMYWWKNNKLPDIYFFARLTDTLLGNIVSIKKFSTDTCNVMYTEDKGVLSRVYFLQKSFT